MYIHNAIYTVKLHGWYLIVDQHGEANGWVGVRSDLAARVSSTDANRWKNCFPSAIIEFAGISLS